MNRDEITFNDVSDFVAKHVFSFKGELSLDTRLGEDLKIVGDDASEFLDEFSKEFDVDLSGMDFKKYFPYEATADMHYYWATEVRSKSTNSVMRFLAFLEGKFWKIFSKNISFRPVTLGKLLFIAQQGKWQD